MAGGPPCPYNPTVTIGSTALDIFTARSGSKLQATSPQSLLCKGLALVLLANSGRGSGSWRSFRLSAFRLSFVRRRRLQCIGQFIAFDGHLAKRSGSLPIPYIPGQASVPTGLLAQPRNLGLDWIVTLRR